MSNYEEDFDEEIIDESIEQEAKAKPQKAPVQKFQLNNNNSHQDLKSRQGNAGTHSSIKDVDSKSKNSVRKTVVLSKIQPKKDESQDEVYKVPLKNITDKNPTRYRNPSYDEDDIEDEISALKKGPKKAVSTSKIKPSASKGVKEFDLDMLGISVDKRSRSSTPPKSFTSQVVLVSYYDRYRYIIESDISTMSLKELEADNKKARETLKEMNEQLTKVIERARVSSLAPRKVEFKNKSNEDKLRTTLKEIENNNKILEFTVNEYTAMKSRVDQIKDPNYELDVEEKTMETRAKIEEVKRSIKTLNLATGNIAKDLDVIDKADGVAPLISEANEKGRELAILKRKFKKLADMNQGFEDEREAKNLKLEKAQEQYSKLIAQAGRYKVTQEDNKLAERYNELKGKVRKHENHVKHTTNTNEKYVKSQLEKAIEELFVINMRDTETMERLETMIAEQRTVLIEMIEKEEHKIDKNTLEVINKIKISMDGNKMTLDPTYTETAESSKPQAKPGHSKPPAVAKKSNNELYDDLPLYKPPNIKVDSLLNRKDLAKKEIMAIKEKTKRDEEERRSLTPKADQKPKTLTKENTKPNLRAKANKMDLADTSFQQAEQEKNVREKTPEVKKKTEDESVGLKPNFSKPNLFKKSGARPENQDLETKPESIQLPEKLPTKPVQNNEREGLSLYGKKEEPSKDLGLKIPGYDDNKAKRNAEPLKLDDHGSTFFITEANTQSKKGELTLPGGLGEQKRPTEVKKNDELTLGMNYGSQKKPLVVEEDEWKPTIKQAPTNTVQNDAEEINIGGLSRLNRLKRGGNNAAASNEVEKNAQTLELPGSQKPSGLTNGGAQQLTLNNNNSNNDLKLAPSKTDNDKLFNYNGSGTKPKNNDDDDLFGNGTTGNKGYNIGGFGNPSNNALGNDGFFGKKEETTGRGGGRDRTHLTGAKANEDDIFGAKKETKTAFDPDDIFASNDKTVKKDTKVEAVGGFGLGNSSNNQNTGTLGPTGIPGVRSGRAGVAGRPKQITGQEDDIFGAKKENTQNNKGAFDSDDMFGSSNTKNVPAANNTKNNKGGFDPDDIFGSSNTKNVPATNNSNAAAGFGLGFGLGAAGGGFNNKKSDDDDKLGFGLPSKTNQEEVSQPRRMRMNEHKKDDGFKNKEKNLASQAENGGGFFDELQL